MWPTTNWKRGRFVVLKPLVEAKMVAWSIFEGSYAKVKNHGKGGEEKTVG